jgi:hypothetical protein
LPPETPEDYSFTHSWIYNDNCLLKAFESEEEGVVEATSQYLDDILYLVREMHDVYGCLLKDFSAKPPPFSKNLVQAGGSCFMECRRLLTLGMLTLLRGHIGDSAMYARRAIESMCFALKAWSDEEAAEAWLNFMKSNTASRKYRAKFQLMKLLEKLKETVKSGTLVYEKYEWLSNQVHPTYSSLLFARRSDEEHDGTTTFHLSYFDAENAPNLLAVMFFEILSTHLGILYCVADFVIGNDVSYAEGSFFPLLEAAKVEYFLQRDRWKTLWEGDAGKAPPRIMRGSMGRAERMIANLKVAGHLLN